MFIGYRGTGVGSRIKGFRRYGGRSKENIHTEAANVCITNKNLTSQTCVFYFGGLSHPRIKKQAKNGKRYTKVIKGTVYCTNPACISLSALDIALVGLSTVLFGSPLPPFCVSNLSSLFTSTFKAKREDWKPRCGSGGTKLKICTSLLTH